MTAPIDFHFHDRARAAIAHLVASGLVACFAATLVFVLWYPGAYRYLSGGRDLFLLVTSVDVVLGPLLTFVVFDRRKKSSHLRGDLTVIATIQVIALAYGIHTVYQVRPIALVFERDRFTVITAASVHYPELSAAPVEYRKLSITGPWLLSARRPSKGDEYNDALFMGLRGIDIGQRPLFWRPYSEAIDEVRSQARPLQQLVDHYPTRAGDLLRRLSERGVNVVDASFVPVIARGDWVAILCRDGSIVDFEGVDGFF